MSAYPAVGDYPEALVRILLTVMERTPQGGASMDELKEAYQEARGNYPSDKTIYRALKRLNRVFDPLVYSEGNEELDLVDDEVEREQSFRPAVQSRRKGRCNRYVFTGELPQNALDANHAFMITLGLYAQQKGLLRDHFQTVIGELLRDVLSRSKDMPDVLQELQHAVHVSGYGPADPSKNLAKIKEIMRSIRMRKRLRLDYQRSYDGHLTRREVEPYGLISRFNKWYLVAFCWLKEERRVFLLDHIQRLHVVEASAFEWPDGFSMEEAYGYRWGVWTDGEAEEPEIVRLQVQAGPSQRFRRVTFHDTQKTRILEDGSAEVRFTVAGAREMIPWLMSWGSAVKVLEPEWLQKELVSHLEAALGSYRG